MRSIGNHEGREEHEVGMRWPDPPLDGVQSLGVERAASGGVGVAFVGLALRGVFAHDEVSVEPLIHPSSIGR